MIYNVNKTTEVHLKTKKNMTPVWDAIGFSLKAFLSNYQYISSSVNFSSEYTKYL
jgi:hypothetical protein